MAAPRRCWLVFGFSAEEAAGEPSPGPGPRRLEPGPEGIEGIEGIRRVWPAWSYAVLDTGERPPGAAGTGMLPGPPEPPPGPGAPRSPGGR